MDFEGNVKCHVSMAGFNGALSDAGPETLVVIDFSATWCGPCKAIAPQFESLADEYAPIYSSEGLPPKTIFIKVDVDKLSDAARLYDIKSLPTFVLIRNGEVLSKFSGADSSKLRAEVKKFA